MDLYYYLKSYQIQKGIQQLCQDLIKMRNLIIQNQWWEFNSVKKPKWLKWRIAFNSIPIQMYTKLLSIISEMMINWLKTVFYFSLLVLIYHQRSSYLLHMNWFINSSYLANILCFGTKFLHAVTSIILNKIQFSWCFAIYRFKPKVQ